MLCANARHLPRVPRAILPTKLVCLLAIFAKRVMCCELPTLCTMLEVR